MKLTKGEEDGKGKRHASAARAQESGQTGSVYIASPHCLFFENSRDCENRGDDLNPSPWLTSKEAAAYLRVSVGQLRNLVIYCELPHYKFGRLLRFRREEMDGFLKKGGQK